MLKASLGYTSVPSQKNPEELVMLLFLVHQRGSLLQEGLTCRAWLQLWSQDRWIHPET